MNITIGGTLEEIDAFVSRYRIPSETVIHEYAVPPPNHCDDPLVIKDEIDTGAVTQKPESDFFIPKFAWDRNAEKSYKTLFFCEHEDGKVMLSYCAGRFFTTKEKVLTIPYPLITGYEPLIPMSPNKRSALRIYRQYLAESSSPSEYTEKSTQERIRENALKKHKATEETNKPEMKAKTKELREMVVKMGIQ